MNLQKNILCWNCQGAGSTVFLRSIHELIRLHHPLLVILMETRISGTRAMEVISSIGLPSSFWVYCVGFAGGIWLLWNSDVISITVLEHHFQFIHAKVNLISENKWWFLTAIYASPQAIPRRE